jgi:outer membrane protein OmpA-like peptidoglycan-associated protein
MDGQIARQSSSYRQGLVLGLTMAEILILLVFCLLIAMAAFLRIEQQKRETAEANLGRVQSELARYQDRERTVRNSAPGLREKLEDAMAQLKATGVPVDEFKSRLIDSKRLSEKSLDADKAIANAKVLSDLRKQLPGVLDSELPQKLADALEHAKAAENVKAAAGTSDGGHKWPPIIRLTDSEGFRFKSGSAELSPEFRTSLTKNVSDKILEIAKKFDVDVIEVVGHTDEQPVGARQSNLDRELAGVLRESSDVNRLVPADNAGLGLARAVAVASVFLKDPHLEKYKILPLSGAQLIKNDETLATDNVPADVRERRRIEIRLRKSTPSETAVATPLPPVPTPISRSLRNLSKTNTIESAPLQPPLWITPSH